MNVPPRIVAFVPARKGSERIPGKNLKRIGGLPIAIRKLDQLRQVSEVSQIYLDTDSTELAEFAIGRGYQVLHRPSHLASNQTDGHELFEWEASNAGDCDIVLQALPTSPFLGPKTMSKALRALISSDRDSVLTVMKAKNYVWEHGIPSYGFGRIPNSVDLEPLVIESMGFYAMKRSSSEFPKKRVGSNPLLFEISRLEATDIDDQEDFELAESIERGRLLPEVQRFGLLKQYLSSPLLADVSKAKGLNSVASSDLRLVTKGKILGRARTMQLVPLKDEAGSGDREEWREIYNGLDHYKGVNFGDVLCVGSEVQSRAYFGEINAHLALRVGASGAIVDSFTRDTGAVNAMGFPVFARGSWAKDILFEGKAESIGQSIQIGGITVQDGDIVYADSEGILFFSEDEWEIVLSEALLKRFREDSIKYAIIGGIDPAEALSSFGDF